jgi:cyclopropane-fatty-acyl-phospholipid synthase
MSAGFDDRFRRMWRYYLAYCGAGFAVGRVDVSQIVLERP